MERRCDKVGMDKDKKGRDIFRRLRSRYLKTEVDYFDIFIRGVSISKDAANSLKEAVVNGGIDSRKLLDVWEIKLTGDRYAGESMRSVEDAFITPIDQSDIIEILKGIENIIHSIESVAKHMEIMKVAESDEYIARFIEIMVYSCERLYDLMVIFKDLKKKPNGKIMKLVEEINELERLGDRTYAECMSSMFSREKDPIEIIKKKEIYQRLEYSLDCIEHVADMVEKLIVAKM